MNVKVLTLSILVAAVFIASTLFTPPVQTIPSNRQQCNLCHATGGFGTLSATYLDGSRPENNVFTIQLGETIAIALYGIGAQDQNEPGVALVFDPAVYHHITIKGASPGGESSFSYYVRDGDENDHDPDVSNVKGVFQLTVDSSVHLGEFDVVASYMQAGPSGVNVNLILKVEGVKRETSSISMLVSPLAAYANEESVFVSGGIRPQDADNVVIEYRTAEEWKTLTILSPKADGSFIYEWKPTEIEEYGIRARWEGNKQYEPTVSDVFTISVLKSPGVLMNQLATAVLLGMLIILIGVGLFYWAGRSRYLKQISNMGSS
ncbi:MAG: hypothetical protein ACE5KU_02665 [Nitrososphaerales archaeon]